MTLRSIAVLTCTVLAVLVSGCAPRALPLAPFQAESLAELEAQDVRALEDAARTPEEWSKVVESLTLVLIARGEPPRSVPSEGAVAESFIVLGHLGENETERARQAALFLLQTDTSHVVRYYALRFLRTWRDRPEIRAAIQAARDDPSPAVADEARLVLR